MPLVKLKSGAIKEVSAKDAKLLVLVKRGTIVESETETKAIQAEAVEQKEEAEKPKRTYQRKDLKAA
jgi:hypothetical protein